MNRLALLLVPVLALAGCASVGPQSIAANRPAYNMAVAQTNDQELLLNLVRILYRDTLYFTSVERIAASLEFNQGLSGAAGVSRTTPAAKDTLLRSLSLGASLAVNDKPTVFYAPVDGEKFVRQMLTPMNPELLLMLGKSGWSLDRVLRIGAHEMNGLRNAPSAAGPTPALAPDFRDFQEAARLLRVLQRDHLLDLATAADGRGVELRLAPAAREREEARRFRELLRLDPARDRYRIIAAVSAPDTASIAITTRPLLSALSYVAQGVDAPAADRAAGKVRTTLRADGSPFDWTELLGDVFRVHSAERAPDEASVAIRYRGHWFYVADDDLDSKATFVLLTQLMALHATPAGTGPAMSFSFGQ